MYELRFDSAHAYLVIAVVGDDARRRLLLEILSNELLGEIALQDDGGAVLQEFRRVSGAGLGWIGKNKGPYRLPGSSLDARHEVIVAARKLPIHQDQSIRTQAQQRVTAFASKNVQPGFHQVRR